MKAIQLIKMTATVLLTLYGINANASAKSMSIGQIAAAEPQQNPPSKAKPVPPFSEVLKGRQEDYTDIFAVPLDNDEGDEDLELERMGSESKK